jgi:hypothetical protein
VQDSKLGLRLKAQLPKFSSELCEGLSPVRVSTIEQTTENQVREIRAAGFNVESRRTLRENISGSVAANQRPGFSKLVDRMEAGDVLVVT